MNEDQAYLLESKAEITYAKFGLPAKAHEVLSSEEMRGAYLRLFSEGHRAGEDSRSQAIGELIESEIADIFDAANPEKRPNIFMFMAASLEIILNTGGN